MSTQPENWEFDFDHIDTTYHARLVASRYMHGGGAFVGVETWSDEFNAYEPWTDFSCNVEDAFLMDPEYDIIVNHNASEELTEAVIASGFIEPDNYTQVRSGFVLMPVHEMTDKGREWFDAWIAATED